MNIDSESYTRNGKTYTRHLLRQSYRDENGKPQKKTICNLSDCSDIEIEEIKAALARARQRKKGMDPPGASPVSRQDITTVSGPRYADLFAIHEMARRIGLTDVFGDSCPGLRALWLVFAAMLGSRSRLSASRLARKVAVREIMGLSYFDEDDLYEALDWMEENHERIEDELARRTGAQARSLFLYDVTSSYFEGQQNEMGDYGYNRDGKKGKKQIVVGLLCDVDGEPVSVETFPGNTQDTVTCLSRIADIKRRFGCERIVLVGDRGMIKTKQKEALAGNGWDFITAITKAQIGTLLKRGVMQMSMFDERVVEVIDDAVRYVLRRNPVRAAEMAANVADKLQKLRDKTRAANQRLARSPRATVSTALNHLRAFAKKLKVCDFVSFQADGRDIAMEINEAARAKHTALDGCYVIQTNITSPDILTAQQAHDRYKDLAKIEQDFRVMKTTFLDNRPIFVNKANRTRAHVFTTMIALKLSRAIEHLLAPFETELITILFAGKEQKKQVFTLKDVLESLGSVQLETLIIAGTKFPNIQQPGPVAARILEILDIQLTGPTGAAGTRNTAAVATTGKRRTDK